MSQPADAQTEKDWFAEATKRCSEYHWDQAIEIYQRILENEVASNNLARSARLRLLLAESYFRAAFQAGDNSSFRQLMTKSRNSYGEAANDFKKAGLHAETNRMTARGTYTEYWLASPDIPRMKGLLDECLALSEETISLARNEHSFEYIPYAEKDLLTYLTERLAFIQDSGKARERLNRALSSGEAAIRGFESTDSLGQLVEALHLTIFVLTVFGAGIIMSRDEVKQWESKASILGAMIENVSQKLRTAHATTLRSEALGLISYFFHGHGSKALKLFEDGFEAGLMTRDSLLIGRLYNGAIVMMIWIETPLEPEQRRALLTKAIEDYSRVALTNFELSNHPNWLNWGYEWRAECHYAIAVEIETSAEKRREEILKTINIAKKGMEYEPVEGWTDSACSHTLSKCLVLLSKWTSDLAEKKRLLSEALSIREQHVRNADSMYPHSFDNAVQHYYLGQVRTELATTEPNHSSGKKLLESAASDLAASFETGEAWPTPDRLEFIARIGEACGDVLSKLHHSYPDPDRMQSAIKAYRSAVNYLGEVGSPRLAAPLWWKIGSSYEIIGEYKQASEAFRTASHTYQEASKKALTAASTFANLAFYMDAWVHIEGARAYHGEEQCKLAALEYRRAANVLQGTKSWNHLSKHYSACSWLENGEALSRSERPKESIESLQAARQEFGEAKSKLERKIGSTIAVPEREELGEWLKVTEGREQYCFARMILEEAKLLDRTGEKDPSRRKYLEASEHFRTLASIGAPSVHELETLALFCSAWAKMKEAEMHVSADFYTSAAETFQRAGKAAVDERYRPLAQANAAICNALASGILFHRTRDATFYSDAKRLLGNACDLYEQAEFERAAGWTRATQKFFEGLVNVSDAEAERDSAKKAELYRLGEKHLELAASLYAKAGFRRKESDARKQLERVREEKRLLISPAEALAGITVGTETSIGDVALLSEKPVGLERFEGSNITGACKVTEQDVIVGSNCTVEIEMTNLGKVPAMLIRLENVLPDGLEVGESPTPFEGSSIDLRGKRLEQFKTHRVQISARALRKGLYELRPILVLVNDKGERGKVDLESRTLLVRDKSPQERSTRQASEQHTAMSSRVSPSWFESERGKSMFDYLAKEFVKDYVSKGLYIDTAGWRSLTSVIREIEIPRSSLYGPNGRDGPVLSELDRKGLIEKRIFQEQRGRGGAITRVRVAYEYPAVRSIVKQSIVEAF